MLYGSPLCGQGNRGSQPRLHTRPHGVLLPCMCAGDWGSASCWGLSGQGRGPPASNLWATLGIPRPRDRVLPGAGTGRLPSGQAPREAAGAGTSLSTSSPVRGLRTLLFKMLPVLARPCCVGAPLTSLCLRRRGAPFPAAAPTPGRGTWGASLLPAPGLRAEEPQEVAKAQPPGSHLGQAESEPAPAGRTQRPWVSLRYCLAPNEGRSYDLFCFADYFCIECIH